MINGKMQILRTYLRNSDLVGLVYSPRICILISICSDSVADVHKTRLSKVIGRGEENSIDDRGFVYPSGDQIRVVMETRSNIKEKSPGI